MIMDPSSCQGHLLPLPGSVPGSLPQELMTHIGSQCIQSRPKLQAVVNPLKLCNCKFEVHTQQKMFAKEKSLLCHMVNELAQSDLPF